MLCPQCRQELIIVECEETELDVCYEGHGIWFDADELRQLFEIAEVPSGLHDLEARLKTLPRHDGPVRRCPRCRAKMRHVEAPGPSEKVILDRCPRNHGLWFDKGELHAVLSTQLKDGDVALETVQKFLGAFAKPLEKNEEGDLTMTEFGLFLAEGWLLPGIVIGVVVLAVFWFIGIYNGLVRARNEKDNAWSQIDVQLKRRHDLIPNLVETAKGYMKHEQETLERVIQARNQAIGARGPAEAGKAEGALGAALTGFFGLAESYPDLKANQNFLSLQEELTSTENRIGFARQAYNDAATTYNNKREVFPANLVAGGFQKAELFEIADSAERNVPKVEF